MPYYGDPRHRKTIATIRGQCFFLAQRMIWQITQSDAWNVRG